MERKGRAVRAAGRPRDAGPFEAGSAARRYWSHRHILARAAGVPVFPGELGLCNALSGAPACSTKCPRWVGYFSEHEQVLWYEETSCGSTPISAFVIRNRFASHARPRPGGYEWPVAGVVDAEIGIDRGPRARVLGLPATLLERGWLLILGWVTGASIPLLTPSRGFLTGSAR